MPALAPMLIGVSHGTCADCAHPRVVAVEMVQAEVTHTAVVLRPRVTVMEGCGGCEGSTVVL